MILLIDIGNSRVKWTTVSRGKARPSIAAARPDAEALADQGAQWWDDLKAPRRILASNAAGPAFAAALDEWCKAHWQVEVEFIAAQARARGVRNAYTVPDRLGPDRWAALIAARRRSDGAVCVIDAGTALTLDVLAAGGEHQGGLIIPGLTMMRRALLEGTGAIRPAATTPEHGAVTLLARDTRDGVEGGTLYALVAIIDRVVADVGVELGQAPLCLISGGDAGDLLPLLAGDYHHVPDLVLEGLAILAEKS